MLMHNFERWQYHLNLLNYIPLHGFSAIITNEDVDVPYVQLHVPLCIELLYEEIVKLVVVPDCVIAGAHPIGGMQPPLLVPFNEKNMDCMKSAVSQFNVIVSPFEKQSGDFDKVCEPR